MLAAFYWNERDDEAFFMGDYRDEKKKILKRRIKFSLIVYAKIKDVGIHTLL